MPFALHAVGNAYYLGEGVELDYSKAFHWYLESTEYDDVESLFAVGYMYSIGRGCERNLNRAKRFLTRAAEQNHARSQVELGFLYVMEQDFLHAHLWYNLAAIQGHERGEALLRKTEKNMTDQQIAAARTLEKEWLQAHPEFAP